MFKNKSNVATLQYQIDLSIPVSFYCKLVSDIAKYITEDFSVSKIFKSEFLLSIDTRLDNDSTVLDLATALTTYLNTSILDNIDLSKTDIYLVYKTQKILFYNADRSERKRITTSLTELIKKQNIFKTLTENLENQNVKNSVEQLASLTFQELFRSVVDITQEGSVWIPYLPFEFLKANIVNEDYIDQNELLLAPKALFRDFDIEITQIKEVDLRSISVDHNGHDQNIGIKYGHIFFPTINLDLQEFIRPEVMIDYSWLMFKEVFSKPIDRKSDHGNKLLTEFKKSVKTIEMAKILSNLQKNLYLPIDFKNKLGEYNKYFDEVSILEKLTHVENYNFFVSTERSRTALGIYANEKPNKKSYNLLHWITGHDVEEKHKFFRDSKPPTMSGFENKLTFKPELAFYYLRDFFEDFLGDAIRQNTSNYISNFQLWYGENNMEIDFLVKTESKLCLFEAKTKLTNEYIEQFIEKSHTIIENLQSLVNFSQIEFYLISAFSDNSCSKKQYFIENYSYEGKPHQYNSPLKDYSTTPYYFYVPMPQHPDRKLTCISEPNYENLVSLIHEICQQ